MTKKDPKPTISSTYEYLIPLWEKWGSEIDKIVPQDNEYYNLIHGVTDKTIKTYVKLGENHEIPDELINFYKVYDVKYNAVTSPFGFSINDWNYDLIPFKAIQRHWEDILILQFGDELDESNFRGYSEKVKASDYTNPGWNSFAEGRNGDYLLYDTDPSKKGTYGQIIELINEAWERNVVSDSLSSLIQKEIDLLQNRRPEKFDFILGKE